MMKKYASTTHSKLTRDTISQGKLLYLGDQMGKDTERAEKQLQFILL